MLKAGRSGPAAVAIAGEPGIGKTRLMTELAASADADRRLVLEGAAAEIERRSPFAVIVDAFDDYLASLNPRSLEALGGEGARGAGARVPVARRAARGRRRQPPRG